MKNSLLFFALTLSFIAYNQCDNGANYYPATIYDPVAGSWVSATSNNWAGEVIRITVVSGDTYEFSTCADFGGEEASYDTQLTLRDEANLELLFDDDGCGGLQSYINWTATYSGTVYLHLSEYDCVANMTATEVRIFRTDNSGPSIPSYNVPSSGSNTITASGCNGNVYDPGLTSNYPNDANGTLTILPETSGTSVSLTFTSFLTEAIYDSLYIYNGSTSTQLIGAYEGSNSPGTVTSSSFDGALTLVFTSDNVLSNSGFEASVSCVTVPLYNISDLNLDFSACPSINSTVQNFTVEGLNMESGILITAPSDIELSEDNILFSSALTIGSAGTISNTIVYARQSSSVIGSSGAIDFSATNAASKQIATTTDVFLIPGVSSSASASVVCEGGLFNLNATPGGANETIAVSTSIPDNNATGLLSNVTLSNTAFLASDISSVSLNLTHTWVADLELKLTAPDGSFIILSNGNGGMGDDYVNTVFKTGGSDITAANAPFTGTFAPEQTFSSLTGSADGIWTLTVIDGVPGDLGSFTDWNITIGTQNVDFYTWSSDSGTFSSSVQNPADIELLTTTDYSVTATSSDGCESSSSIQTITAQQPPIITSSGHLASDASVCGVSEYVITMDNTTSGIWTESPSGSTLIQTSLGAQTIAVNPTSGFNKDITLKWKEGSGVCATSETEVVIRFHQPQSVSTPDTDTYLWSGFSDTDWSRGSNWYKWDGSMWLLQSSAPNSSEDVINLIPSDGVCITSNIPIAVGGTFKTLNVAENSELDLGANTINILGGIENNGVINAGSGTITMNSEGDQTVSGSGSTSFSNLSLNKPSGNLILASDIVVKGDLDLSSNILNPNNIITVGTSSANPGDISNNGGVVIGKLRRFFENNSGSKFFPIGIQGTMRDVSVDFINAPGSDQYLTISYNTGYPQLEGSDLYAGLPLTIGDQLIQNYDDEGYWEIIPGSLLLGDDYNASINDENYNISIHCNELTNEGGSNVNLNKVRLIKSAGPSHTSWEALNHSGASGSDADFIVTAQGSGFSFFGAGTDDGDALPVELVTFSAHCNEGVVELIWETASEFNSAYFDVEYSRDGQEWNVIHSETAMGISNELTAYGFMHKQSMSGDNYYRLNQFDIDGVVHSYYDLVVNADCQEKTDVRFSSFPNPSTDKFTLSLENAKEGLATCRIVDPKGNVLLENTLVVKGGYNLYSIEHFMAPGVYYIYIQLGDGHNKVIKHTIY